VNDAVVAEHAISDATQTLTGLVVAIGNRLLAAVAAGHHQHRRTLSGYALGKGLQQEMMERRVGQHQPQGPVAWGHVGRHWAGGPLLEQNNGPARRLQQGGLAFTDEAEAPRCLQVGHHQGKRLGFALLAPP
jgi:hypothetical protein